ncbi:MAG: ATP-binding protein [Bacteroidota bacterium]
MFVGLKIKAKTTNFFIFSLCFLCNIGASAQSSNVKAETANRQQQLLQANHLLDINQNDDALTQLEPLLEAVQRQQLQETPFGWEIQLALGRAYAQKNQKEKAITLLLELSEKTLAAKEWATYASTCLTLGALYGAIAQAEKYSSQMEAARSIIFTYQLEALYPLFALRMINWHESYGYRDSVAYYIKEALQYESKVDADNLMAQLTFAQSLGDYYQADDFVLAKTYYEEAIRLGKQLQDYSRLSEIWFEMGIIYYKKNFNETALLYNDSTIWAAYKAIEAGNTDIFTLRHAYYYRSRLYRNLGKLDSALNYATRYYTQEIAFMKEQERENIIEIDERYQDEKKTIQLAQQAEVLQQERSIRGLLIGLALLFVFFGLILAYYYLQLRKEKRITEQQAEQLRDLDAAKSRFFANVSHELRTPLTLLLGPVNSLLKKKKELTQQHMHLLQLAHRSGHQLGQLIDEILDLQKLEMGKLQLQLEPTVLTDFFQVYLAHFDSLSAYKSISYTHQVTIPSNAIALFDREKCRQMLYNLLSNAFKYTPHQGQIKATISLDGQQLSITVADTGPGIHPDDLPHLFDRYFQTSRADQPAEGGTGIGLALCREYTHLLGGNIQVDSKVGEGSTFHIHFPIELIEATEAIVAAPIKENAYIPGFQEERVPTAAKDIDKPSLLLVEDNVDLQTYIQLILSDQYHVTLAQNGAEALDILARVTSFDLIISDLMMPIMDGYQLLERLKAQDSTRHLPVVMLTARAEIRDKLKALRLGVDDYLLKPFDEEELKVRLANLHRNHLSRQAAFASTDQAQVGTTAPSISEADRDWLASFEAHVDEQLHRGLLSVTYLADTFAMSESTLLRQVKRLTGLTPSQYLREVRLHQARQLLEHKTYRSIAEVADKAGFADTRSFSRSFKKRFGKLPSEV